MILENPSDHINDLLASALWPGHPLGQSISGSLESIAKITRSSLRDFARLHHFRSDLVIATAGPMHAEEILATLLPLLPKNFTPPPPRLGDTDAGGAARWAGEGMGTGPPQDGRARRRTDRCLLAAGRARRGQTRGQTSSLEVSDVCAPGRSSSLTRRGTA